MDSRPEIAPRLRQHRDFESPLLGELEEVEPLVVRRLFALQALDVARIDVHRVQRWLTSVEPERGVVGRRRRVRWAVRVVVSFERRVWAFVLASDEAVHAGHLGALIDAEGLGHRAGTRP